MTTHKLISKILVEIFVLIFNFSLLVRTNFKFVLGPFNPNELTNQMAKNVL